MGTLKVAILEQDGAELDVPTEMDLNSALSFVGALPGSNTILAFYGKAGTTGHVHVVNLTWDEASSLMLGTVASVVKDSSSNGTVAHVHSTTITWDAVNYQFVAVMAVASLHSHDTTTTNRDIAVIFYQLPGATGHSHNVYLTGQEAIDLMSGIVASVVKDSSSNGTTPHVHSTTITWDATNYKFLATAAIASLHVHDVIGDSPSDSWQVLGKTQLTVAANATSIITIPPRTLLRITCIVTGYSGGGIASLRFGTTAGAVDSGNNYNTRFIRAAAGAPNSFTNVSTTTTNFLRLASQNIVLGRQYTVNVTNYPTARKMCTIGTASEAGAAGVEPTLDFGQGMYANTTAQIISVQLISTANNLSIGSGFIVEGINLV